MLPSVLLTLLFSAIMSLTTAQSAPPSLQKIATLRVYLDPTSTTRIPSTAATGNLTRSSAPVKGGYIQSEDGSWRGEIPELGSADWVTFNPATGHANMDVNLHARVTGTSEGHTGTLFVHYKGVMKMDSALARVSSGTPDAATTQFGEHEYAFSMPVFETGAAELKWLEQGVFVGRLRSVVEEGRFAGEYEIFRVGN